MFNVLYFIYTSQNEVGNDIFILQRKKLSHRKIKSFTEASAHVKQELQFQKGPGGTGFAVSISERSPRSKWAGGAGSSVFAVT